MLKAPQHRKCSGVAQKAKRSPLNQTGLEANLLQGRAHGRAHCRGVACLGGVSIDSEQDRTAGSAECGV